MTPDTGLKSTPSTSRPSEEDAQPHDDHESQVCELLSFVYCFVATFDLSVAIVFVNYFCFCYHGCKIMLFGVSFDCGWFIAQFFVFFNQM